MEEGDFFKNTLSVKLFRRVDSKKAVDMVSGEEPPELIGGERVDIGIRDEGLAAELTKEYNGSEPFLIFMQDGTVQGLILENSIQLLNAILKPKQIGK
jgi:hypothetical protein